MGVFKIKADRFEWIGGVADDPQDLCLHGHVMVQFGDTVLEDTGTVSATALYLLKTLTEECVMAERNSNKRKWTADEVQQWYIDTGAFTYANPDDLNIIVKKPRREGFTVNWANPKAYLLQGAILAIVFAIIYLLR